ncbi:MAG: hypothetical protein JJLCMIEE_02180 [Acidimicrobiales bacterium]|nr:hypothetical protein [Acidimicrobiales bacterium]
MTMPINHHQLPMKRDVESSIRVGSGSSASKLAKKSSNLGMAKSTITRTAAIAMKNRITG